MSTEPRIMPGIFRAYDIRGIVGQGLDAEAVRLIGQAIGSELLDSGEDSLYTAADARLSSPLLARALREGLLSAGCHVIDLGVVPTPLLYFATHTLAHNSGIMLTGSHNPRDYNGIKVVLKQRTLADNQILRLRDRIEAGELREGKGTLSHHAIVPDYQAYLAKQFRFTRRFRVAIDCGSGVTGLVAPALFAALGCEVTTLCGTVDGNFPCHHPDPTRPENLSMLRAVMGNKPHDLGIAFDGDGDRVILMTTDGQTIDADKMLLAFVKDILPSEPGARVVFDVKSTHHLPRTIRALGGVPVMCKSGHSFVKREMHRSQAVVGGEYSAHIFFKHRWFGFDDGLYAAARFLELMDHGQRSARVILDSLPNSESTPELFIPVAEDEKFALVERLSSELRFAGATLNYLDGIRADFADGWGLVRASNTTPNLVLRFEADDREALKRIQNSFGSQLLALAPDLQLPF